MRDQRTKEPSDRATWTVCALLVPISLASVARAADGDWTGMNVPGVWEEQLEGRFARHDGYAWYRCWVKVPDGWGVSRDVTLLIEAVDNAHDVYFNGERLGGGGEFPPNYRNGLDESKRFRVPPELIRHNQFNLVAVRVYDHEGRGGFKGAAPAVSDYQQEIVLSGSWQFRPGDDRSWADGPLDPVDAKFAYSKVVQTTRVVAPPTELNRGRNLSPTESIKLSHTAEDLSVDLVLSEPVVAQPLHLSFDERGRLWVVQYRQYPYPAGLTMVSRDVYWRAMYDKPLPPPPYADDSPFRGRDRITIHEDTDGDGTFDKHKVFIDGLNITTSIARGRGGVWVLSPPQLLFYPDRDGDDVPDGDPVVHLDGFGLQDTHSVVNSLRFGPDGWLYAAQGSTVSADVTRPGSSDAPVHSIGQLIWRYHPEKHVYEIFAEGGGNAFGVEVDAVGRTYSGHNGGDTRGFHYVQGGYFQKGFSKHGPLSNPYSFGYFPQMRHERVERFTHDFIIYEGVGLPQRYHGKLIGVEPMQGRVVLSEIKPDGSTFQTHDLERIFTSDDKSVRPVELTAGPDGAVYVADFYEQRISHGEHYQGYIDPSTGRIYRLRGKDARPAKPVDLGKLASGELVELFHHPDRWHRETALRLLGDRRDVSVLPRLRDMLKGEARHPALDALWAIHLLGALDDEEAGEALGHADPYVRLWAVRLIGDDGRAGDAIAAKLAALAQHEPHVEVRSQLACTAKRLPGAQALPIVDHLLRLDADADDPHMPLLLWWVIESKCASDRDAVVRMFADRELLRQPMVQRHVLERLMRRFAATGLRRDLLASAALLRQADDAGQRAALMRGFEQAYEGRSLGDLPDELVEAIAQAGGGSRLLRVRRGDKQAVDEAIKLIGDDKTPGHERVEYVRLFGQIDVPAAVPVMLRLVVDAKDDDLRKAALTALMRYDDPSIGRQVVEQYAKLPEAVRPAAQTLLAARPAWARGWLEAADAGRIDRASLNPQIVDQLNLYDDAAIKALIDRLALAPAPPDPATADMPQRLASLHTLITTGKADPYAGRTLFTGLCAACHKLFGEGGEIGPDLTTANRTDLYALMLSVVNPDAEIREGFESFIITTHDNRTVAGFLVDRDDSVIVLRGVDGQNVTLAQSQVKQMSPLGRSLMPSGLIDALTEQQVRDLFAYLRSSQPLNK